MARLWTGNRGARQWQRNDRPGRVGPSGGGAPEAAILVEDVDIAYGDFVIQRDLDFTVRRGEIFVIMGGSGCGKTTVMRAMVGLKAPARGRIVSTA